MRELKFRIWIKDEGRFYDESDDESYLIVPNGNVIYESGAYEEDGEFFRDTTNQTSNVIVEQYTGLRDKNGKEIYDGDIVEYDYGFGTYVVTYRRYDASFVLEDDNREEIIKLVLAGHPFYEVIGNIHENPELLEGEE